MNDSLCVCAQLWAGNPAQYVRDLTADEISSFEKMANDYSTLASSHSEEFLPYGTAYLDAERIRAEDK
jgi:carbonic anhydrase/acetyltransferase-like protein (isoleucine patch superfamily)